MKFCVFAVQEPIFHGDDIVSPLSLAPGIIVIWKFKDSILFFDSRYMNPKVSLLIIVQNRREHSTSLVAPLGILLVVLGDTDKRGYSDRVKLAEDLYPNLLACGVENCHL